MCCSENNVTVTLEHCKTLVSSQQITEESCSNDRRQETDPSLAGGMGQRGMGQARIG
jgi:hypothetical protein